MANDCTYVNNLIQKKNFDNIDEDSGEMIYNKITDNQLNIKVEGCCSLHYLFYNDKFKLLKCKLTIIIFNTQVLMI